MNKHSPSIKSAVWEKKRAWQTQIRSKVIFSRCGSQKESLLIEFNYGMLLTYIHFKVGSLLFVKASI